MEKTIFLFNRNPNRSRDDFDSYYIGNHAPLGARLTRCLQGYTVNLVRSDWQADAITEHWVPVATDLLTSDIAYATPADFDAVYADDRTLFDDSFNLHVVVEESYPVGEPLKPIAAGTPTPGVKLIWFYTDASTVPPPPANATRVTDNRIGHRLQFDGTGMVAVPSEYALMRMAWADSVEQLGSAAQDAIVVQEFPFITPPLWGDSAPAMTGRRA